jgi:hypothetical protein
MTETTPEEEPETDSPFATAPNVDGHDPAITDDTSDDSEDSPQSPDEQTD